MFSIFFVFFQDKTFYMEYVWFSTVFENIEKTIFVFSLLLYSELSVFLCFFCVLSIFHNKEKMRTKSVINSFIDLLIFQKRKKQFSKNVTKYNLCFPCIS